MRSELKLCVAVIARRGTGGSSLCSRPLMRMGVRSAARQWRTSLERVMCGRSPRWSADPPGSAHPCYAAGGRRDTQAALPVSYALQRHQEQQRRSWGPPHSQGIVHGALPACAATRAARTGVSRRYSGVMRHPVQNTIPGPETPPLSDQERAERLRRLMERVFSPDGLDRDTLEHIEHLTGEDS
jgi:hypothetical protein